MFGGVEWMPRTLGWSPTAACSGCGAAFRIRHLGRLRPTEGPPSAVFDAAGAGRLGTRRGCRSPEARLALGGVVLG